MLATTLLIIAFVPGNVALSCMSCSEFECDDNSIICKGGRTTGMCGCCQVCAKVEYEECQEHWGVSCDVGLKCVRGYCQRVGSPCYEKKCGYRQKCVVTKQNKAVCICSKKCNGYIGPVCGSKNNRQYKNYCELQQHECRSGQEISHYFGPCIRCFHEGKTYRLHEIRIDSVQCLTCTCSRVGWICDPYKPCPDTFCFIFKDRASCPPGFVCKDQIPSIPEQNIPGVGKCIPVDSSVSTSGYRNNTTPRSTVSTSGHRNISTLRSTARAVSICELPVKTGSCDRSLSRWYFNTSRKKCLRFIFSGCHGNANNFRTKSSCRSTCMPRKGQKFTMSALSKRNTKPTKTIKNSDRPANMTDICQLPPAPGPCRAALPQWYYNPKKKRCSRFIYGGCGGNENNFITKGYCKAACMRNKGNKRITPHPDGMRLSSESIPTSTATTKTRTKQQAKGPTLLPSGTSPTSRRTTAVRNKTQPSSTIKKSRRSKKTFRCHCSKCKRQTGKSTCRTRHGCFTLRKKTADGQGTFDYGCLESGKRFRELCKFIKPGNRHRKMDVECCQTNLCNGVVVNHPVSDGMRGRTDTLRTLPKSAIFPTPTAKKETPSTGQPRCYDGHSKKFFGESEEWKPNDCTVCSCISGEPTCVATVCKHPQCLKPIRIQGKCCPVCDITEDSQEMIKALAQSQLTKVLVSIKKPSDQRFCEDLNTGELYLSGQNWKVDDCTRCYCQGDGKIACAVQMCSDYPGCASPVKEKGHCCPVCKDGMSEQLTYPENEVADSPDSCLDPVTGDYYRRSEMWQQDDCTACICGADRKYQCRKTTCQELTCREKVKLKGRCCLSCASDTKTGCTFEGQKFLQGEYKLLADHCTLCECRNSEWICSSSKCRKDNKPVL